MKKIDEINVSEKDFNELVFQTGILSEDLAYEITKQEFKSIAKFVKNYLNVRIIKHLGTGGFGAVFLTSTNDVLKITSSKEEAIFSNELIGESPQYNAHIYSVLKLGNTGYYSISREYLDILTTREQLLWGLALNTKRTMESYTQPLTPYQSLEFFLSSIDINKKPILTKDEKNKIIENYYLLISINKDFLSYGLKPNDLIPSNIGKRDNQIVCLDCKHAKGGLIKKQLEKKYYETDEFVKCHHCGSSEK